MMGEKSEKERGTTDPPEREGRRDYLKTVGGVVVGLAVGGAAAWLAKPTEEAEGKPETVTETITKSTTAPAVTVTVAPARPTVKIGLVEPLTGLAADWGQADLRGAELLAEHVKEGRFPNIRFNIDLVVADTTSKPDVGVTETRNLADQDVVAIQGCLQSAVTYPCANVANELEVPFLTGTSIVDALTQQGWEYVFRTVPSASMYTADAVRAIIDFNKKYGTNYKTFGFIYENTDYGAGGTRGQQTWLSELMPDAEIVFDESYNAETVTSMDDIVARLKAVNPDILMHTGYTRDATLLIQTLKKLDWFPKVEIGTGGQAQREFVEEMGSDANYVMVQEVWFADILDSPGMARWKWVGEAHEAKYGEVMDPATAWVYMTYYVIAVAVQAVLDSGGDPKDVKSFRKALRDALAKTVVVDVPMTPTERVDLTTADRQNPYGLYPIAQVIQEKHRVVWPIQFASIEPVWPAPSWQDR